MSTASLTLPTSAAPAPTLSPTNRWLWVAAAIVTLAFFISEHDTSVSLYDAFTETADEMEASAAGGNSLRRIAFLMLGGMGVGLAIVSRQKAWRVHKVMAGAMLLLFTWCVASFLWSFDPAMCLRRQIVLVCWTAGAFGLARYFTLRELCLMTLIVTASLAFIGLASEIRLGTFRPWSPEHRFSGSLHPNSQGMNLGTLCLSALALAFATPQHRRRYVFIFICGFGLLLLTRSRTATGALLLSSTIVASLQVSMRLKLGVIFTGLWTLGCAALVVTLLGIDLNDELQRGMMLGRQQDDADSLSGRFLIWPEVLYYIGKRPWLGYGYDTFWTADHIDSISTELQWGLREAHSAYLETMLGIGIIGLGLALVAVLCGLTTAVTEYARNGSPLYAYIVGLLVFGMIDGLLESGMSATSLIPFLSACALLRIAVAGEATVTDAGGLASKASKSPQFGLASGERNWQLGRRANEVR